MNYLRNARTSLRSKFPLSDDQMRAVAPSIFASEAHGSRSDRYTYIPTSEVLNRLRAEGFQPFEVAQSRARDEGKREHTRHLIRLRRDNGRAIVGKEVPEVALINSHDGSSSYQMYAGVFRFICENGMVVAAGTVDEIRVPHTGDVINRVIEGAYTVVGEFDRVLANAERMKAVTLAPAEQHAFAGAAIIAKYGEERAPVTGEQVLRARRTEDTAGDLWSTFNRVQENLVRGGLRTFSDKGRRMRTREVTGISQNVSLNRALWALADQMATLKAAA